MKTLTISIAEDVYQRASQKAAAAESSLPEVVQDLLSDWVQKDHGHMGLATNSEYPDDWLTFLDELASRPLKPGPSVGTLNREELYQRGISGH